MGYTNRKSNHGRATLTLAGVTLVLLASASAGVGELAAAVGCAARFAYILAGLAGAAC